MAQRCNTASITILRNSRLLLVIYFYTEYFHRIKATFKLTDILSIAKPDLPQPKDCSIDWDLFSSPSTLGKLFQHFSHGN